MIVIMTLGMIMTSRFPRSVYERTNEVFRDSDSDSDYDVV